VTIQGTTATTIHEAFTGSGTLRDLKVVSKSPADPGESLYGIFASGASTTLTLDQVVVDVAGGGAGGAGAPGAFAANTVDAGCTSGNGSNGGAGAPGGGAASGTLDASGYVATSGGDAGAGQTGQNGSGGGTGTCANCDFASGTCQTTCTIVVKQLCASNGQSGCAGGFGGGGSGGTGGGASIAVTAWDAHVTIFGGLYTAANGGNGGVGGAGGDGGAGAPGATGANATCVDYGTPGCVLNNCSGTLNGTSALNGGTAGGVGGSGGPGGQGGGGSGGVSYAIVQGGAGAVTLNGNPKLAHGDGGTGAAVGGANGTSSDRFP
jgi:hypothetical protein